MTIRRILILCILITVAGCRMGPSGRPAPVLPGDPAAERIRSLEAGADLALRNFRYDQAQAAYERILEQAELFDDAEQIRDARHNIAWCLLKTDRPEKAAEILRRARAECERRGLAWTSDSQLLLAEAELMAGNPNRSLEAMVKIGVPGETEWNFQIQVLRALIFLEKGELANAEAVLASLPAPENPAQLGDREFLAGKIAQANGDFIGAAAAFGQSARFRMDAGNPTGMANALAAAGEAFSESGDPIKAAGLYLRAGRSAFQADRFRKARIWLTEAGNLHPDSEVSAEADDLLEQL